VGAGAADRLRVVYLDVGSPTDADVVGSGFFGPRAETRRGTTARAAARVVGGGLASLRAAGVVRAGSPRAG
jgi:hypothetical protein